MTVVCGRKAKKIITKSKMIQKKGLKKMIKYYVLKNDRTVIAVLNHTENDCVDFIKKRFPLMTEKMEKKAKMPGSFRVEVVCHPNDEFNVDVGKAIAKKRLLTNYWNSRHKALTRVQMEVDSIKAMCDQLTNTIQESLR